VSIPGAAAVAIAAFQILANCALLARGLSRLPAEIQTEGATARIADLLRTMFLYGVLANLCVSGVLLAVAPAVGRGEPLGRHVAAGVGLYYVVLGVAAHRFSPARHRGLLVFTLLGLILLAALGIA
jgi:hypothetical protein